MNRRTFLKSIAIACGAAVVCPGELVKTDPWVKAAVLRKKNAALGGQKIQRTVIFDEFATPRDIKYPWKYYYTTYRYQTTEEHKKLLKVFKKQFEITKFHPPIFVQGIPIFYRSSLYNETTKTQTIQKTHKPNPLCSQACDSPS